MSRLLAGALAIVMAVAAGAARLGAHHSFAMFDTANRVTLTGTVTQFQWTNPHAYIEIDVPDGTNAPKHWTVELGSTSILMQGGWKFNDVKPSDNHGRHQPAAQRPARRPAGAHHAGRRPRARQRARPPRGATAVSG